MSNFKLITKTTGSILFVIVFIFFSTLNAKNIDKFNKADKIADYFSGILLLNQSKYEKSYQYFKKLDGLEKSHSIFSSKYIYSLVNSGNFYQAFHFSKKLEKDEKDTFESDIIIGINHFKNSKFNLSSEYFLKAEKRRNRSFLDIYVAKSLYIWSNLNNEFEKSSSMINKLDARFDNLKKIQNVLLNCYFDTEATAFHFDKLTSNTDIDFSRYNYFYAKYLSSIGEIKKAKKIIKNSLKLNPNNLLISQYKIDLDKSKNYFDFDCKKREHVIAEILYITANALSSQSIYPLSNFYLNLSKYLNNQFYSYDSLLAENFYKINDFEKARKIYQELANHGDAFNWYSNKQISKILIQEKKEEESLNLLEKSFKALKIKGVYQMFDYAEFLKNNEKFEDSILYYTKILSKIDNQHPLYPEVRDSRGVAYERLGEWDKAEKDLLESLNVSPDQAYVINYLAYSWIEQGVKIEKSLEMLKKANTLKSNDPYIIDSLGWALYKLKRFKEAKDYLQSAVKLLPADPIVNDHYGDVLWKNGEEIQARYYWKYVLNLKKADKNLKSKVEDKLIKGL